MTSGFASQVSYLLWSSHRSDNMLLCCWFLVAVVKLFNAVAEAQHTLSGDGSSVPLREAKRAKEMSKDSTRCTALNQPSRLVNS